jgi:hypothetical protein
MPVSKFPTPELDPLDLPDLDTDGARRFLRDPPLSKVSIYRLGRAGEIDGYVLCGRRLWRRASLRAYRARQIAKGPQFAPRVIGKRVRGRPRKVKPAPGKVDEPV